MDKNDEILLKIVSFYNKETEYGLYVTKENAENYVYYHV